MKPSNTGKQATTGWHPNFRIEAALPDTKPIRTTFLIQAISVGILLGVGYLVVDREMALSEIRAKIGTAETSGVLHDIAVNKPKLAEQGKLQREFAEAEKRFREIEGFTVRKFVTSDFLIAIANTLPRLTKVDTLELAGDSILMRGTLVGASEKATVSANQYRDKLAADPVIDAFVQDETKDGKVVGKAVRLKALNRDASSNRFTFEIEMKLKPRK